MVNYGFRYKVVFKGEEVEQLLIAPDKAHAEKAFEYHKKISEKNPDKVTLISTEVEEIPEEDLIDEQVTPQYTEN